LSAIRKLGDLRPPTPLSERALCIPPVASTAVVALTTHPDAGLAIATLARLRPIEDAGQVMLLPNPGTRGYPGSRPHLVAAVARHAGEGSGATIALPPGTRDSVATRWQRVAEASRSEFLRLGQAGWDRVRLAQPNTALDDVFVPCELADAGVLIAFVDVNDRAGALGIWRQVVHRYSRLRAGVASLRITTAVDLAAPFSARYVLDLSSDRAVRALSGLAWTDDIVAAELIVLAMRTVRDREAGIETLSPWEDARVQAAAERGMGVAGGNALVVRVEVGDNRAGRLAERISELLGCRVEQVSVED
jgi:hypothetical protein